MRLEERILTTGYLETTKIIVVDFENYLFAQG
jgi:hypothetical protein